MNIKMMIAHWKKSYKTDDIIGKLYYSLKKKKCKPIKNTKLLCIADTHDLLKWDFSMRDKLNNLIKTNDYDAICLLGDITREEIEIIIEYNNSKFPIIGIKGNHDDKNQFINFPEIINLNENIVTINGIKYAGMDGSIKYNKNRDNCKTQEESLLSVEKIPLDADVLITHTKLYDSDDINKSNSHIGLIGTAKYFYENRCFLNIHGHLHYNYFKKLPNKGIECCVYKIQETVIKK